MPRPSFKQVRQGYLLFLKNSHARDVARAIHQLIGQTRPLRGTLVMTPATPPTITVRYKPLNMVGINRAIARGFPYLISDAYLYALRHGTIGDLSAAASSA